MPLRPPRKCSTDGDGMVIFGVTLVCVLQEPEVVEEGVAVEVQLAGHLHAARLGLHAGELDALLGLVALGAAELLEEVEMPPGAAIFAVGDQLHADLFLLPDQLLDLGVLDLLQVGGADLAFLAPGAGFLQRLGAQEAADLIGADTGLWSSARFSPSWIRTVLLQAAAPADQRRARHIGGMRWLRSANSRLRIASRACSRMIASARAPSRVSIARTHAAMLVLRDHHHACGPRAARPAPARTHWARRTEA